MCGKMNYLKIRKAYEVKISKNKKEWVYDCWLRNKLLGTIFNKYFSMNYKSYKRYLTLQIKSRLKQKGIT